MKNPLNYDYETKKRFLLALAIIVAIGFTWIAVRFLQNAFFFIENTICDDYKGPLTPPPAIPQFQWHNTGVITLWFDDAWLSQFTTAEPIMEKFGFKGALAIALRFVCQPGFMSWAQIHTLQSKGWETTSHSVTHNCNLSYYNAQTIQKELLESKQAIMAHGLRADQFVMPCGYSSFDIAAYTAGHPYPPIVETAPKYYSSYRTTDDDAINPLPVVHPYDLKAFEPLSATTEEKIKQLIETAAAQKGWVIFVFHQIDNSNRAFSLTASQFNKILTIIKASGLPVVLPAQALAISGNSKTTTEKQ
jgi:peptidoglycan/xylan/chitin deacetylase (PgdA/CDA1 family)